ncbi:MAG: TlyA family RNA methyltransferase [Bacillota bacterium]|nr:TlyA family RNA methyltransferase [Bacillota bacterium]
MKNRLDVELVERGLVKTRSKAGQLIKLGAVLVNGVAASKSGILVDASDELVITVNSAEADAALHSVGRGGLKLIHALVHWQIPVGGLCLDIGASTGGFTEVLLRHGADLVIAIDVGKNQLDPSLKANRRVVSLEETDIRKIESRADLASRLPDCAATVEAGAHIVVCDVSFISLTAIMPFVKNLACADADFIFLIKPQFELVERKKRKKGIVKSAKYREEALNRVLDCANDLGFRLIGVTESPIAGGDGNHEFLAYFKNR